MTIYAWHTIVFDDEPAGFIATTTVEAGSQTVHFLGFNLRPRYWGKGIMFESLKILIEGYFREKSSCMILAQTTSTNRRCIRLLRKLNFLQLRLGFVEKIRMYWETRSFNWVRSFAVDSDMWQTHVELPAVSAIRPRV